MFTQPFVRSFSHLLFLANWCLSILMFLTPLAEVTPVAGLIFETKNRAIFRERIFGRDFSAREQVSRAVILEKF